jgi:hypothetical protein
MQSATSWLGTMSRCVHCCVVLQSGKDGQSVRLVFPGAVDNQQISVIAVGGDPTFIRNARQPTDAQPNVPSVKYLVRGGSLTPEAELAIYNVKEQNEKTYREEFSYRFIALPPGVRGTSPWSCGKSYAVSGLFTVAFSLTRGFWCSVHPRP